MAKKLTKAEIAKNPTKAINSGKMKKKSGEIVGPGKIAARLAAKKSVKEALKNAKKAKPLAEPKSAVRVKPAAKQRPNKPDDAKVMYKVNDSGGRAYNKAAREYEEGAGRHGNMYEMQAEARDAMFRAPVGRKTSIQGKKLSQAEARKATTPKRTPSNPARTTVKINSAKSVRVRKVSPKKSK